MLWVRFYLCLILIALLSACSLIIIIFVSHLVCNLAVVSVMKSLAILSKLICCIHCIQYYYASSCRAVVKRLLLIILHIFNYMSLHLRCSHSIITIFTHIHLHSHPMDYFWKFRVHVVRFFSIYRYNIVLVCILDYKLCIIKYIIYIFTYIAQLYTFFHSLLYGAHMHKTVYINVIFFSYNGT